jgi:hypothetical protein
MTVQAPAVGLLIVGALNAVVWVLVLVGLVLNAIFGHGHHGPHEEELIGYGVGILALLFLLLVSAIVVAGALRMRKVRSYGLSLVASALALTPGPCCVFGVPFGVWSLVVLFRPEVRAAFGEQEVA